MTFKVTSDYMVTTLPNPTNYVQGSIVTEQQTSDSGCLSSRIHKLDHPDAALMSFWLKKVYCDPQKKDQVLSIIITEVFLVPPPQGMNPREGTTMFRPHAYKIIGPASCSGAQGKEQS